MIVHSHLKNLNLGKPYLMNLAVKCVIEVNVVVDHDGIPLVWKAIIRFGIALRASLKRGLCIWNESKYIVL